MRRSKKAFLYAGAIAVGAIAALILVPALVTETNGQSPNVLAAPAQAGTIAVAQAEPIQLAQAEQPAPAVAPAAASPTFVGGATSIQESYSDWQISCGISSGTRVCSMIQQQTNRETRQRVLAVELQRTDAGMEGALVLPFGILLDNGATLRVDEGAALQPQRFRTCLPAGCVVPLNFDSEFVGAMARGGQLNVMATAETGNEISFAVSLRGFSAASSRIAELIN